MPRIDAVAFDFNGTLSDDEALLCAIYRRPRPRSEDTFEPGSAEELELRLAAADEGT